MKVYIGPYKTHFGVRKVLFFMKYFCSENKFYKLMNKIENNKYVSKIVKYYNEKFNKRKIKIKIDSYDLWSLDDTLSEIILVSLKAYSKNNYVNVENVDLPEELHYNINDETYDKIKQASDFVFDEMIVAFELILEDCNNTDPKIERGLYLFSKYFRHMWN